MDLVDLLAGLHRDILSKLSTIREVFTHPTDKGDASEEVWLELFDEYLPRRYKSRKAHVVDSLGNFSDQIDVVVFDRQYTPFIFNYRGKCVIPAESVYAVFEAKQTLTSGNIAYAQQKIASVRKLERTSLPIPHAGGVFPAKPAITILGGLLTLSSNYSHAFGPAVENLLEEERDDGRIDIGCIANAGMFAINSEAGYYEFLSSEKAATIFLFELIARLQASATVPMIDIRAYARWLA